MPSRRQSRNYSGVDTEQEWLKIELDDIMAALTERLEPRYDLVVAVERGGVLPGYLAARRLDIPFTTVGIELRDDSHRRRFDAPRLYRSPGLSAAGKRVLLVDDVSNSGATLAAARDRLSEPAAVETLVISGQADISLFGPHDRCILWPWE